MPYEIVAIQKRHIAGYSAVVSAVLEEMGYRTASEQPSLEQVIDFVGYNIERKIPQFVALNHGEVIGWCEVLPDTRSMSSHCGTLGIGLLPRFRGRGIGGSLMARTLEAAQDFGCLRIALLVQETNFHAIALYRKFHFREEGLHINAVRIRGRFENLLSMALVFPTQHDHREPQA